MKPTISVVIPNYNRANLIGETLNNLRCQTRPPDEIIVVDDGSTDESVSVIKSFGDHVKLLQQPNSGPGVARNLGLEHATGEFVQFFDSDDLCTFNKLGAQADALERTGADFAYGPWLQARLKDGRAIYSEPPLQQRKLPESASALSWFLRGWVVVFQSCMFRRSFLDRVGRYRPDLMPSEDSEFLFRILKAGARSVYVPEALVLYRVHEEGQITGAGMRQAQRTLDWLRYSEIVARQLGGEGEPVRRVDALRWRAIVWAAHRQATRSLGCAAPTGEFDTQFGWPEAGLFWLMAQAKRLRAGLRARVIGTRVPPCYQPDALSSAQKRLICEVGYEAMPANHPGQREAQERPIHP
jgi:glycosyltransferase involved in cell wall biosynthesis